jgi:hypothetical protein
LKLYDKLLGKREYGNHPESGMPLRGNWVVRAANGHFVDSDRYRNDLKTRLLDLCNELLFDEKDREIYI